MARTEQIFFPDLADCSSSGSTTLYPKDVVVCHCYLCCSVDASHTTEVELSGWKLRTRFSRTRSTFFLWSVAAQIAKVDASNANPSL